MFLKSGGKVNHIAKSVQVFDNQIFINIRRMYYKYIISIV